MSFSTRRQSISTACQQLPLPYLNIGPASSCSPSRTLCFLAVNLCARPVYLRRPAPNDAAKAHGRERRVSERSLAGRISQSLSDDEPTSSSARRPRCFPSRVQDVLERRLLSQLARISGAASVFAQLRYHFACLLRICLVSL